MYRRIVFLLCAMAVVFPAFQARAVEFQAIGFESSSMGGAGVACATGSFAPYYNPALLAEKDHGMEISISAGAGIREMNIADNIDALAEVDISKTLGAITAGIGDGRLDDATHEKVGGDATTIRNSLISLSEQNGLQIMPSISLGMEIGNFGFGIYNVGEASAYAVVDGNRVDTIVYDETSDSYHEYDIENNSYTLSDQAEYEARSFEYAYENNLTYLQLTGLTYIEIPVSYGHKFNTKYGDVSCGGSLKLMPGKTYDMAVNIDTASEDLSDKLEDAEKNDTSFGIDLGFLYQPAGIANFAVGLVCKNINTPKFDTASGGELEADPQVRTGVAYNMLGNTITLAADLDLTTNETYIPGYDSQMLGGGINFHPLSWLSLRGGLMRNLKESDDGTILTAGIGFGIKWFQFDLSGHYSTEDGSYDGNDIPRYTKVQLAIVSKWF